MTNKDDKGKLPQAGRRRFLHQGAGMGASLGAAAA